MGKRFFALIVTLMVFTTPAFGEERTAMKIKISAGNAILTATMLDNETSRDFISMMPMTLTLKDYAGAEKVSDLPRKLLTHESPQGHDPSIGDITLYAPWGNLAIFYRNFGFANGLVLLGTIDSETDKLSSLNGEVRFELLE